MSQPQNPLSRDDVIEPPGSTRDKTGAAVGEAGPRAPCRQRGVEVEGRVCCKRSLSDVLRQSLIKMQY